MDYIRLRGFETEEVIDLLKDWIKLYPNSFSPDVEFKIYELQDSVTIIKLHEDLSSMAVALLVLYFGMREMKDSNVDTAEDDRQPMAYITIDDTEVLLKQNVGKRAKLFSNKYSAHEGVLSSVIFLLEDNYCLDYNFEKRPQPVKDCGLEFEESELSLPDDCRTVRVGDVVKKKIDEILEPEGLTPKKMMWYLICGIVGTAIGFLIVYFTT